MSLELIGLAAATLVSEDLACLAAGLLVSQGKLHLLPATVACILGIYIGDLLLFAAGRSLGRSALRFAWIRRFVTEQQVECASQWIGARGLRVVLLSRFTPGLRLPTYFAAGVLRTSLARFSLYLLLAASLWTPMLVASTGVIGRAAPAGLLGAVAVAGAVRMLAGLVTDSKRRRRLAGWWRCVTHWEFWPWWLAYLPVFTYIAWLAVRFRSLTLFTAANPGIPLGGFAGESKSDILRHLPAGVVPSYARVRTLEAARSFLDTAGLEFPVVLKPDVGERGRGVAVVRSPREMDRYFAGATGDIIVQRYVPGGEFGVFYYRRPGEDRGHIFSITEKRFPEIAGDGRSTVEELILSDRRAVCLSGLYLEKCGRRPDEVLDAGERLRLVEIGSHCRGAIFLDGAALQTPALADAIHRAARRFPGFYIGRFDIRAASNEDFRQGRFQVIELNGVTAEPTHIYDPAVSIWDAYRVLFTQWRLAFEIGAANRDAGLRLDSLSTLLRVAYQRPAEPLTSARPQSAPSACLQTAPAESRSTG